MKRKNKIESTVNDLDITSDLANLSNIPSKYHKFIDVFSKAKVETLALYYLYDL